MVLPNTSALELKSKKRCGCMFRTLYLPYIGDGTHCSGLKKGAEIACRSIFRSSISRTLPSLSLCVGFVAPQARAGFRRFRRHGTRVALFGAAKTWA